MKTIKHIFLFLFLIFNFRSLYALCPEQCDKKFASHAANCENCRNQCFSQGNEIFDECKDFILEFVSPGESELSINQISFCTISSFFGGFFGDINDFNFTDCKNKCEEVGNRCGPISCCGRTFDPIFDFSELLEDIIDFEVFGPEGEEEFIDLEIKIDGVNVTNFDQVTILDNIIRVEYLVPGRHTVTIRATDYGVRSLSINVAGVPDVQQEVPFMLRPGASVSGVVQWYNDYYNPIEDATVMLVSLSDETVDYATTDEYGAFEFPGVSAGSYRAFASATGFSTTELSVFTTDGETEVDDLDFTYLSSGDAGIISGSVTYNSVPQEGVTVRIALSDMSSSRAGLPLDLDTFTTFIETTTDEYGEFEITTAPREFVKIGAVDGTYVSEATELDLKNNSSLSDVEIELSALNTIAGTVEDAEENPLEGAIVVALPTVEVPLSDSLVSQPYVAVTDEYGDYSILGLPSGTYDLYVNPENIFTTNNKKIPLLTTYAGDDTANIEVPENGFVSGTVSCDDGEGPTSCDFDSFKVGISADSLLTFPIVSGSGEFMFPDLPPGKYNLFVEINGQSFYELEIISDEETELDNITLVTESSHLGGQVIDENSDPVPYARIIVGKHFVGDGISVEFGWPTQTMITDGNGEFEMEDLATMTQIVGGGYYIIAEKQGVGRSQPLLIEAKNVGTIELHPIGALEGTITCDSTPIPAIIKVQSLPDKSLSLSGSTHSDGFYRFDRLAPGDYRVSVIPTVSVCGMETGVEIASDEVTITSESTEDVSLDIYNEPPVADAGEDQVVEDTDPVTLDGTNSSDPNDDIVSYEWYSLNPETLTLEFVDEGDTIEVDAPETFALYVLVVTDDDGAQSSDFTVLMYIPDTTPPVISSVTLTPSCLWPDNHKYVPYSLSSNLYVSVTDDRDTSPTVFIESVTSSEADNAIGSGNTLHDAVFGATGFCVRSERQGDGSGRTYTVTVGAQDDAGNTSHTTQTIFVPHHDQECSALPDSSFVSDNSPLCDF